MTNIPIPSTNQPIDYDFLNTIVQTINYLSDANAIDNATSISAIFNQTVASNKVKVLALTNNVVSETKSQPNVMATVQISFGSTTFKGNPFVVATPRAVNSANFAGCSYFISNLSSSGCTINIKWLVEKSSINMFFDVLAIGVPA